MKKKGPKRILKVFIDRGKHPDQDVYDLVDKYQDKHADELDGCVIGVAWHLKGSGRGEVHFVDELQYQLHGFDVILILPKPVWTIFDAARREAMIHSLIVSIEAKREDNGEEKLVERLALTGKPRGSRVRYQLKDRPIGEHALILKEHGLWTADLVEQQRSISNARQMKISLVAPSDSTRKVVDIGTPPPAASAN